MRNDLNAKVVVIRAQSNSITKHIMLGFATFAKGSGKTTDINLCCNFRQEGLFFFIRMTNTTIRSWLRLTKPIHCNKSTYLLALTTLNLG